MKSRKKPKKIKLEDYADRNTGRAVSDGSDPPNPKKRKKIEKIWLDEYAKQVGKIIQFYLVKRV